MLLRCTGYEGIGQYHCPIVSPPELWPNGDDRGRSSDRAKNDLLCGGVQATAGERRQVRVRVPHGSEVKGLRFHGLQTQVKRHEQVVVVRRGRSPRSCGTRKTLELDGV